MEYHFGAVNRRNRGNLWTVLACTVVATLLVGILYFYSQRFFSIETELNRLRLAPTAVQRLGVTVTNTSRGDLALDSPVALSGRIYEQGSGVVTSELERVDLGRLGIGQRRNFEISVPAPAQPGHYRLVLDLVREKSYWYADVGNFPKVLEIEVE